MNAQKVTLWEVTLKMRVVFCMCILLGINCGHSGMPMNGTVGTFITSVAEFTCDDGFELIGDTQRVCQPNGTWSNMIPTCARKLPAVMLYNLKIFMEKIL